jgi:hypothetical protein
VDDVDLCLHEFRYRFSEHDPGYMPRRPQGRKRLAMPSVVMRGPSSAIANARESSDGASTANGTGAGSKARKANANGNSSGSTNNKKQKTTSG